MAGRDNQRLARMETGHFPFATASQDRHTFNRLHLLIRQMAVRVCGYDETPVTQTATGKGSE